MCIVCYVFFVFCIKGSFVWALDTYTVQFFNNRRTHFWETLWLFSYWSGPHDITFACGKWWKHGLGLFNHQGNSEQYFPLSFMERQKCHVVIPSVFLPNRCCCCFEDEWMSEGLFEEMKWLGQVCCNICLPKALLLYYVYEIRVRPSTTSWVPHTAVKLTCLVFLC